MTDQIPADKVREILDEWERIKEYADWEDMDNLVQDVRALLPTPPPPTLADMTSGERRACQWMQCDVKGMQGRRIVSYPGGVGEQVGVLLPFGHLADVDPRDVTPLPDLPRLEWPDNEKAEDVPPVKVGDAIESAADPRLDALPAGSILLDLYGEKVEKISDEAPRWTGPGCFPYAEEGTAYGPWMVLHIGEEVDQ